MKYMIAGFINQELIGALSGDEMQKLVKEAYDWVDDLRRSGRFVASVELELPRAAVSVREAAGTVSVTDGPYAETKEQLGGFSIVEARDLNEAIQLASRSGAARFGTVEVRPVHQLLVEAPGQSVQPAGA